VRSSSSNSDDDDGSNRKNHPASLEFMTGRGKQARERQVAGSLLARTWSRLLSFRLHNAAATPRRMGGFPSPPALPIREECRGRACRGAVTHNYFIYELLEHSSTAFTLYF
jgi:hypothetical protein